MDERRSLMATKTEVPTVADRLLDFYRRPAPMTSPGRFAPMFDELPRDVVALTRIVQGLALHEYASDWYGVSIPDERRSESHIRSARRMLGRHAPPGRATRRRPAGVLQSDCVAHAGAR